jgi:hypothetical protein
MLLRSAFVSVFFALCACQPDLYDPDRATRAYPFELHQPRSVDIQVFRQGENISLYNATATSYANFDLWLNQRYVAHVDALPAGANITLSLWDFWDERGEAINAGGLFRVDEPTPIRLAEIQLSEDEPLIGLVTIRAEPVD